MAYRDDRVAMLARADALEQALDEAEAKRVHVEAERDALAAEATLLRAALVRAIGTRAARARAAPARGRPEVAAVLLLAVGFLLAAVTAGRDRPSPTAASMARPAAITAPAKTLPLDLPTPVRAQCPLSSP